MMDWVQCLLILSFAYCSVSIAIPPGDVVPEPGAPEKTELIWPKECQTGPQYWCQNYTTANQCTAVDHCLQTVWIPQSLGKVESSGACKTCLAYIETVKNATSNNITIDQMKIVLDTLCELIPAPLVSKECVLGVKLVAPKFQEMMRSLNPERFCSIIHICKAIEDEEDVEDILISTTPKEDTTSSVVPHNSSKSTKKPECGHCYTLFGTAQTLFNKASRDDVLKKMLEICGELSSFSDLCSANIITYFPELYKSLSTMKVNEACQLAGVCSELYHFHEPTENMMVAYNNAPKETNDEVCDFCLAMVNHLRDMLIANSTEAEFKQVLKGICKQTGSFTEQCGELVDQYYELIYQFLVHELDAQEVCKEVKLCVPKEIVAVNIKEVIPLMPIVPSDINLDEALKEETSEHPSLTKVGLTRLTSNYSKLPLNKCSLGPSYWCTNMTTTKECKSEGALKTCIGVWEKTVLPVDNGDICKICKDMVQQARDQLNSKETQEELKEVFEGSCKLIPFKIPRNECIKAVDEFVPELIETLSSQMNPQIVCATVGLCNSAKMDQLLLQEKANVKKSEKSVAIQQLPIERMMLNLNNVPQEKEIIKRGKEACEICEQLLHYVQQQMTMPKSEAEIKKVIDNVCVKLPRHVASQCTEFITIYGDAFIALLAQQIDPSQVCPRIGACLAYTGLLDNTKPTCPLCLFALEALENKIGNNKTEKTIIEALDHLCQDLPHDLIADCEQFVKKSAESIIDSVLADFAPQETCVYLKFCDASESDEKITISIAGQDEKIVSPLLVPETMSDNIATNEVSKKDDGELQGNKCVICEFIMSKLEKELKDKKTAEEIREAFTTICDHMPRNVRKQCDDFVNQYTDLVLQLLAYSLNPQEICSALHLCGPSEIKIERIMDDCLICEAVIGSLEGMSSDSYVRRHVNEYLLQACRKMPNKYQRSCVNLVLQLAPQIEVIIPTVPPSLICSYLNVCKDRIQNAEILNSKDCVKGSQFWCLSTYNAASCGTLAIEYCQEKVWKGSKPNKNQLLAKKLLIAPSN